MVCFLIVYYAFIFVCSGNEFIIIILKCQKNEKFKNGSSIKYTD